MAEEYSLGLARLWYRSAGFKEKISVTADIWSPTLIKEFNHPFIEAGYGLYYCDYVFTEYGSYIALVYENAVKKSSQSFIVVSNNHINTSSRNKGPSVL
jgi:hypothetical protein